MSTTKCKVQVGLSASETFTAAEMPGAASDADRTLVASSANLNTTLTPTTVPKVDKPVFYQKYTLGVGGTQTIDLTAAPALAGPAAATRTVDYTGAKLKAFLIRCGSSNNASRITIGPGASNPYPGMFGTGKSAILGPGSVIARTWDGVEADSGAVSGSAKTIDIAGTAGDVITVEMIFGS